MVIRRGIAAPVVVPHPHPALAQVTSVALHGLAFPTGDCCLIVVQYPLTLSQVDRVVLNALVFCRGLLLDRGISFTRAHVSECKRLTLNWGKDLGRRNYRHKLGIGLLAAGGTRAQLILNQ